MKKNRTAHVGWESKVLFGLSLLFLLFGLINLGWAAWPEQRDAVQLTIPAGILPGAATGTEYTSVRDYDVYVSWPRWIRLGETKDIRVVLTPAEGDEEASQEDDPAQIVLIEPTLGMLPVTPPGLMQVNLGQDQDVDMVWGVAGNQVGNFTGKIYFSFGFYEEITDEVVAVPIAVVDIAIRVTSLWGFRQPLVLWLGFVGLVLWGALFLFARWVQLKHG